MNHILPNFKLMDFSNCLLCFRFIEEEHLHQPKLVVIVGVIGLLVNTLGLGLLYEHGGHSHSSLTSNHDTLVHLADRDDNENNSFMYKDQVRAVRGLFIYYLTIYQKRNFFLLSLLKVPHRLLKSRAMVIHTTHRK